MEKISIYALHLGFGGVEQFVSTLANILSEDYEVTLIVTYKINDTPAFFIKESVKIVYLIDSSPKKNEFIKSVKKGQVKNTIRYALHNIKLLRDKKKLNINYIKEDCSEIIITTRTFHNNLISKYSKTNNIKIATEHNHPLSKKYEDALMKSIHNFDAFIPISEYLKEYYENTIVDRIYVETIPFYVDVNDTEIPTDKNGFVFIGRLEPEKNVFDALEFIKNVNENDVLSICGNGSEMAKVKEYIRLNDLEDRVILFGFLEKNEMIEIVKKSKYMIITSERESFGIAALESMIVETVPLVYPTAQGVKDILRNQPELISENASVTSLINLYKLIEKMDHVQLKKDIRNTAKYYDLDNMRNKYLALIKLLRGE